MKNMGPTTPIPYLFLCCFLSISYLDLQAATPTQEEMWTVIQNQQTLIDELILKLDQSESRLSEVEISADEAKQNIEATADAFEEVAAQQVNMTASKRTSIGGYGEMHYNNLDDDNDAIGGDDSRDRVDYHRFVLYFGHDFTDNLRFFSELGLRPVLMALGVTLASVSTPAVDFAFAKPTVVPSESTTAAGSQPEANLVRLKMLAWPRSRTRYISGLICSCSSNTPR